MMRAREKLLLFIVFKPPPNKTHNFGSAIDFPSITRGIRNNDLKVLLLLIWFDTLVRL